MAKDRIDLNSDIGESFGAYTIGLDDDVLKIITSANIACGYHAGDHNTMYDTVETAKANGVGIGAHPGLPDLQGFGRRNIMVEPDDVYHFVTYQIGALKGFCQVHDARMNHVKAHGALYNMAATDAAMADAIARAVKNIDDDLILFGLSGSELIRAGQHHGLTTASEVFADRTYQANGTLTPRTDANAMITDPDDAIEQVLHMIYDKHVVAVDGTTIAIEADTVCVHGDNPHALKFVEQLRGRLTAEGIDIRRVGA
ncbi:LamB/YcsF family protein [Lentibacillus sp. CBA3610]|uniref:LamB/YcsF family protein n=1 Tax=Lentibacillus sp. CBA3610 TaxID=2518176 RepID=UPI001595836C|nr:5-oxoprolinase subunit PxpA [Lentibacillus sp. CBA3610]QKY70341.1 LamB/YcsF family protein [Lentibacillus sp. CBA3610]